MRKRIASLLLALVIVTTLLPSPAWAETDDAASTGTPPAENVMPPETTPSNNEQRPSAEAVPSGFAASAAPFSALTFLPYADCITRIIDMAGQLHTYAGCLDVSSVESDPCREDIASYTVFLGDQLLLKVLLHDIPSDAPSRGAASVSNGYYAAAFDISDTHQAYLTGLTAENLESVQAEIIRTRLSGADASFSNIDFIDAEKIGQHWNLENERDSDEYLCWAAAASNMLHYTGWGKAAGFGSPDYLFDVFTTRFNDQGGSVPCALFWFFNGVNPKQDRDDEWAQVVDEAYGDFTGFFPTTPYENVVDLVDVGDKKERLSAVTQLLENNCGVGIDVSFLRGTNGDRLSGHVLTLWGYVREKNDPNGYTYLMLSDSDSDFDPNTPRFDNRRDSPNKLHAVSIAPRDVNSRSYWGLTGYSSADISAVVSYAAALVPYASDIPTETAGSGNRFAYPDLTVRDISIDSTANRFSSAQTVFSTEQEIFLSPVFFNASPSDCAEFTYSIQLTRDGVPYGTPIGSGYDELFGFEDTEYSRQSHSLGTLPAGDYSAVVTVNPSREVEEANYSNNVKTLFFRVNGTASAEALTVTLESMGRQDNGQIGAYASLTCPLTGAYYHVYTAYGNDTASTEWSLAYAGSSFPTRLFTARRPLFSHVFYRLLVETADPADGAREYLSGPIAQTYRYMLPYTADDNLYELTPVRQGASGYAAGEKTRFSFENRSTVDGVLDFQWRLKACQIGSHDTWFPLGSWTALSLEKDMQLSQLIENDRLLPLDLDALPPGDYFLYAEAKYEDLLGQPETTAIYVGSIAIIADEPLPQVMTRPALYPDHFGAYFTADALVESMTECRLGIELSTSDSFLDADIHWFTEEYLFCDGMNLSQSGSISGLFPDTVYYYRAVLEDMDGVTCRGETFSFTTSNADVSALTLNTPLTVSLQSLLGAGTSSRCLIFTPPASGWYHLSITGGDCALALSSESAPAQTREYSNGKQLAADYDLCGGVRYCFWLQAYETADFSVSLTYSDMSVTGYTVSVPALEKCGRFSYLARSSAVVPRGATFRLGIQYGTDPAALTTDSVLLEHYARTDVTAAFTMSCKPDRVYYCRTFLEDTVTGQTCYSAFTNVALPPYEGEPLLCGQQTLTLERGQTRFLSPFIVSAAGRYTISVSGPDGLLEYWDDGWQRRQFSLNGFSLTDTMAEGAAAWFTLTGYTPGDYIVSYAFMPDTARDPASVITVSAPGFVARTGSAADPATMRLLRRGDVNGSGLTGDARPDICDMQCLYELLSSGVYRGGITDEAYRMAVADTNNDGALDVFDLQYLYEVLIGSSLL